MRTRIVVGTCLTLTTTMVNGQATWIPHRCVSDTLTVSYGAGTTTVDTVAAGITYRCSVDPRGPWVMHVVTVDLRRAGVTLDAHRALGSSFGRERVSAMADRLKTSGGQPLVGINADFFDLKTGEIENNNVISGEWVKGVLQTDSPHDEFDSAHTQFGVDLRGRPLIGRFALQGSATSGRTSVPLVGVNYRPPRQQGLVLYNRWYGPRTPTDTSARVGGERPRDPDATPVGERRDSTRPPSVPELRADSAHRLSATATREAVEVVLKQLGRRGDTVLYRAMRGVHGTGGATQIPPRGVVLSATGAGATAFVREVAGASAVVKVLEAIEGIRAMPRAIVGGWPRVLAAGVNVGAKADSLEGTFPRFSSARHPRSALGITPDSATLLMVVVDGRRPWSVGMTLAELGDAMRSLGASDAMNLDGGGSSTLWIRGSVVNYPSDPTGERAVGNALFVLRDPVKR